MECVQQHELVAELIAVFPVAAEMPRVSLREGDGVVSGGAGEPRRCRRLPEELVTDWRAIPLPYLEAYHWGLGRLDPQSWRFYLPAFLRYSVQHCGCGELGCGALGPILELLGSLRGAPQEVLNPAQRDCVRRVLAHLAAGGDCRVREDAEELLQSDWGGEAQSAGR